MSTIQFGATHIIKGEDFRKSIRQVAEIRKQYRESVVNSAPIIDEDGVKKDFFRVDTDEDVAVAAQIRETLLKKLDNTRDLNDYWQTYKQFVMGKIRKPSDV